MQTITIITSRPCGARTPDADICSACGARKSEFSSVCNAQTRTEEVVEITGVSREYRDQPGGRTLEVETAQAVDGRTFVRSRLVREGGRDLRTVHTQGADGIHDGLRDGPCNIAVDRPFSGWTLRT